MQAPHGGQVSAVSDAHACAPVHGVQCPMLTREHRVRVQCPMLTLRAHRSTCAVSDAHACALYVVVSDAHARTPCTQAVSDASRCGASVRVCSVRSSRVRTRVRL